MFSLHNMEIMKDIPKLYTALAEWLSILTVLLIYRRFMERKSLVFIKMMVSFCVLCVIQKLCGMVSNALWLVGMLTVVLVMIATVKTCLRLEWGAAFYTCARGFMYAELLAALEWQIYYYYYFGADGSYGTGLSAIFCLAVYAAGYILFYCIETRLLQENLDKEQLAVSFRQTVIVWMTTVFIFALSNLSYIEVNLPFTGKGFEEIFNIRTLIDLAGFLMLEAFHIQKIDADRKQEMAALRNILYTQYAQYRESQENTELINRRYHDLKHQLQILRNESDAGKRKEYLDEIEQGIRQYEAENKTGNAVLDTILTSKSGQCLRQNIQFTVVADGTLLNHIHVMDLCTVFGNAIDNAIEYEVQIENPESRMIHVSVSGKKDLVCIIVENYYEGRLELDSGLPQTTKKDKNSHGYGLKSIRSSVEKYGGYINISLKEGWFRLEMVIPKRRE